MLAWLKHNSVIGTSDYPHGLADVGSSNLSGEASSQVAHIRSLNASPTQGTPPPPPPHFTPGTRLAGTHLYTWVERGTMRVKCLGQEHNTMTPARLRIRTARSGVWRTAPPTEQSLAAL